MSDLFINGGQMEWVRPFLSASYCSEDKWCEDMLVTVSSAVNGKIVCRVKFRSFLASDHIWLLDLAAKYDQKLSIAELRLFEKTSTKARKARLDVNFLKNCQSLYVFPRFISFALPNTSAKEVKAIRKRLLRSAIEKRSKELKWLENERDKISNKLRTILNSLDFSLAQRSTEQHSQIIIQDSGHTCQETSKSDPTHNFAIQCWRDSNQHVFAPFVLGAI